jgi:hypothetical protein
MAPDLSSLTDDELNKKFAELNQKLAQAYRSGPYGIIDQMQALRQHYQDELNNRYQKQLQNALGGKDKDFSKIIDIK